MNKLFLLIILIALLAFNACQQKIERESFLSGSDDSRIVRLDLTQKAVEINEKYLLLEPEPKPIVEDISEENVEEYIIPGTIVAQAKIEGSGQPGNVYEDYFSEIEVPGTPIPVKIALVLNVPKYTDAGEEQSMMRITHSPRTGRNNHIEIETEDGKTRLYLNSDGTLTREISMENLEYNPFGEVNQMKPGGQGIEFITIEPEILISGSASYHLRVTDTRLGRMRFNAALTILPD